MSKSSTSIIVTLLAVPAFSQYPPTPPNVQLAHVITPEIVSSTNVLLNIKTNPQNTDSSGAYATSHYRNLFSEQGHTQPQIDAKINAAFEQLLHGDNTSQAIYYEAGSNANGPLAYITDIANHDARTEGMSYGMMIAVQMNKKHEFDAVWNWANAYMLVTDTKNPSIGYFAWSMNVDGTPRSDGPAPDGEQYFAMSLYFAANRWGSGTGIYNYKAQADRILSNMRHHGMLTGTPPFRIHPNDPAFIPSPRPGHPINNSPARSALWSTSSPR